MFDPDHQKIFKLLKAPKIKRLGRRVAKALEEGDLTDLSHLMVEMGTDPNLLLIDKLFPLPPCPGERRPLLESPNNCSLLHYAAQVGTPEIYKCLLDSGSDPRNKVALFLLSNLCFLGSGFLVDCHIPLVGSIMSFSWLLVFIAIFRVFGIVKCSIHMFYDCALLREPFILLSSWDYRRINNSPFRLLHF